MRDSLRVVLTILMYAGVVVFLYPYFRGTVSASVGLVVLGAGAAVVFGLLRCYLTEGDCGKLPQHHRDW
jgi:membrane protein CcdC involved in cytochrome C biogenesis